MTRLRLFLTALLTIFSLAFAAQPAMAANLDCSSPTTAQQKIQCGACAANGGTCPATQDTSLSDTIATVINILSVVGGLAAVVMIIIAGFRYVTSGGNAENTKSARNTILYAVIGLIIIAFAQLIVHFVLKNVTTTAANSGSSSSSTSGSGRTGAGPDERPN